VVPLRPSASSTAPRVSCRCSLPKRLLTRSADLQALEIIPRTPSPSPAPLFTIPHHTLTDPFAGLTIDDITTLVGGYRGHTRGLEVLNRMELLVLLKRCREKATVKVKRERSEDGDDDEVVILGGGDRKRRRGARGPEAASWGAGRSH
jgi:hypothetical protein